MVRNYMEFLVDMYFESVINGNEAFKDICKCEKCEEDVKARALNQLKPYYVTSKKGEVFAEYANLQTQYKADVFGALTKSISWISEHRTCGN